MTTYYWSKYTVATQNNGYSLVVAQTTSLYLNSQSWDCYPSYSFNSNTGSVSPSGTSQNANPAWLIENGIMSNPHTFQGDSPYSYPMSSFYSYNSSTGYCQVDNYNVQQNTSNVAGSYVGEVFSTSSSAYPSNGQSGSYWYIYQGIAAPSQPSFTTQPTSGASIPAHVATTIAWSSSSSVSGSGLSISNYTLQYSTDSGSTWNTITTTSSTSYSWAPASALGSTILRVIANQSDGTTTASPNSNTFTVVNQPPNAPTFNHITSSGSTVNQSAKMFINVSDPTSGNTITDLHVQVASDSAFSNLLADDKYSTYGSARFNGMPTTTNTSTQVIYLNNNPNSPGTWYIRAQSTNNDGVTSAWSSTQQYTVAAVPWNDTPSGYGMKAQWMNDIRNVLGNTLTFRGGNAGSNGIPTVGRNMDTTFDIRALHIMDRRAYAEYIAYLTGSSTSWTDVALTNLLTLDQVCGASAFGSVSGFSGNQNSTSIVRDQNMYDTGQYGSDYGSAKATSNGSSGFSISTGGIRTSIVAGNQYSAYAHLHFSRAGLVYAPAFQWFDSSEAHLSSYSGSQVPTTTGWDDIYVTATAPSNAASCYLEIYIGGAVASGDNIWWNHGYIVESNPQSLDRSGQHIIDLRNALTSI